MDVYLQTEDICLWREIRKLSPKFLPNIERFFIFGDNCSSALLLTRDENRRVFATGQWIKSSCDLKEIESLRGKQIFDVIATDFKLYLVIGVQPKSDDQCNVIKNLYSIMYSETDNEMKLEIENVQNYHCFKTKMLALDHSNILWHSNLFDQQPKRCQPPLMDNEAIVDFVCSSNVSLLMTNRNRLLSWTSISIEPIHISCKSDDITKNTSIKIKKLISFDSDQFLIISIDDYLYQFRYTENSSKTFIADSVNLDGGRIHDIIGSPNGYVLVLNDGKCWAYDCYDSRMIRTGHRCLSDVYCLYLHNSTPRLTWLPVDLNQTIIQFGSFNNIKESDIIFEIRFSNYIITMNRQTLINHLDYFREKFQDGEWFDLDFIYLDKYSYASWYEYFRFIYCGQLRPLSLWPQETLIELYDMANEFNDDRLRRLIPEKIYDEHAPPLPLKIKKLENT